MKILFLTIGNETVASSRVRVYGYIPFLLEKGIRYKALFFTSKSKCKRILNLKKDNMLQRIFELFYKMYIFCMLIFLSVQFDAIFIQKVILPRVVWDVLRRLNRNIIFDFDDAIFLQSDISHIIKESRSVVTSKNDFLKNHAMRFRNDVTEIVSPVDVFRYRAAGKKKETEIIIGWIGNEDTSRYLRILEGVFQKLGSIYGNVALKIVGASRVNFDGIKVIKKQWSIEDEPHDVAGFDVGILPLFQDEWARGKGGYKLFLYMAAGIPSIVSDWGVNANLIEDGKQGFIAKNEDEWFEKLSLLIKDRELRRQMGGEARKKAEREYSYEANLGKFYNVIRNV